MEAYIWLVDSYESWLLDTIHPDKIAIIGFCLKEMSL